MNQAYLKKLLFPILVLFFTISGSAGYAQDSYIKKYRDLVNELSAQYGIPSRVILGIAIIESGSGQSKNCKLLHNHFGIVGKNNLMKTKKIKSRYKQYPDDKASFRDFCEVISRKPYYSKLKGEEDHKKWVETIAQYGYSEAPAEWKKRVYQAINKIE